MWLKLAYILMHLLLNYDFSTYCKKICYCNSYYIIV